MFSLFSFIFPCLPVFILIVGQIFYVNSDVIGPDDYNDLIWSHLGNHNLWYSAFSVSIFFMFVDFLIFYRSLPFPFSPKFCTSYWNHKASESKDNLLTSAIHIVSLYYGSMFRYTKKSLLDVAIEQGQPEAVKCLVDLGEPIDRLNLQGKSPLHLATLHGQSAIVEYLLSKGK